MAESLDVPRNPCPAGEPAWHPLNSFGDFNEEPYISHSFLIWSPPEITSLDITVVPWLLSYFENPLLVGGEKCYLMQHVFGLLYSLYIPFRKWPVLV